MDSGVFMSYRRVDSSPWALRIADHLVAALGPDQVFIDVDALSPGEDFAEVIAATLSRCPVVLVLIGPTWLTVTAPGGDRRLDEPTDLVGTEVATALDRDVEVIPVLLEGTSLPSAADLPERLRSLASTVPVEVSASHFDADIKALLARVVLVLGRPRRRVAEVVRAGLGGRLGLVAVSLAVLAALRYIAIKPDAGTVPTARAEASFPLPDGGTELVIDDGALWAWSRAAGELLVVETETDRVRSVATLPVSSPGPFAIAHGSLWVAADEGISRLEPTTGKEIAQIDVEARVTALAPSEDGLWVGLADDRARSEPDYGLLVHLDVDAGRLEEPLAVASPPTSLAELEGIVWVIRGDGTVVRVDPTSGSVEPAGPTMLVDDEERPVDWSPQQLAVADGGVVWVVDRGLLVRLDADTGRVIASVRATTGDTHSALAATPSGIWVDDHRDVLWIDGATNRVAGRIDGLDVIVALAADQDALWVADSGDDRLARLDPRRQKAVS